jgi:hypothetical protein
MNFVCQDVFLDTSPACEKSHDLPQLNRALTSWEILEGGGGEDETVHTRIDRLHAVSLASFCLM